MQTSIPVFALCAVVLGAGAPALTAQDKPIQSGVITNRPASGFVPVPAPAATEEASKLESALHQKMSELNAQVATPPPANALRPPSTASPGQKGGSNMVTRPPEKTPTTAEGYPGASAEQKGGQNIVSRPSQKALERKEEQAVEAATVKPPKAKKAKQATEMAPVEYIPLVPPPPPVSAAQQAQLDDLLTRYKADQITSEQYFSERAKIMAGK